jgi:DNA-binding IclR family transcriptional regulator
MSRTPPASEPNAANGSREDPLFVRSIEKAFRVLSAFGAGRPTLSLSQVAEAAELDKSSAQRFTHTLERLGYLRKDPDTRRFELTTRALDLGYHYTRASPIVDHAMPYLLDLSRNTEEAISLTVLDGAEIVYVARFMSRRMVSGNVIVGTRLPAYCTAPGRAMLACLPQSQARGLLASSERKAYTPHTTWRMPELMASLADVISRRYAVAVEEIFPNDISLGAAITGARGEPVGAVSLSVSRLHMAAEAAETRFAPMLCAAARSMSFHVLPGGPG